MFHQSLHQLDGRPAGISVQLTFEKALVLILSWHLKLVLGRTLELTKRICIKIV